MSRPIPFVDLQAQYRAIKAELDEAVLRVLDSGRYVLGEEVAAFEHAFATYCGVKHAVAVNSGTSALHLAFLSAGVKTGDEIITVSMTFVATVAAILYTGATPILVDVDPVTLTAAAERVKTAITPRTKAIVPVHLHGQPADMNPILEIARQRDILIIEDACQAHGAEYFGQRVGGIGDMGCFSFYPAKNLGGFGEGGIVTTNNGGWAETLRMLRDWGSMRQYHHERLGFNYRMDAIQAAVLRVKLRHLDEWNERRRTHAAAYARLLGDSALQLPTVAAGRSSVNHVYPVRSTDRDGLRSCLAEAGIETGIHYKVPVHLQAGYSGSNMIASNRRRTANGHRPEWWMTWTRIFIAMAEGAKRDFQVVNSLGAIEIDGRQDRDGSCGTAHFEFQALALRPGDSIALGRCSRMRRADLGDTHQVLIG
jgi:dTDP-4-amino-4,6-dideoxygalactose transaminase